MLRDASFVYHSYRHRICLVCIALCMYSVESQQYSYFIGGETQFRYPHTWPQPQTFVRTPTSKGPKFDFLVLRQPNIVFIQSWGIATKLMSSCMPHIHSTYSYKIFHSDLSRSFSMKSIDIFFIPFPFHIDPSLILPTFVANSAFVVCCSIYSFPTTLYTPYTVCTRSHKNACGCECRILISSAAGFSWAKMSIRNNV